MELLHTSSDPPFVAAGGLASADVVSVGPLASVGLTTVLATAVAHTATIADAIISTLIAIGCSWVAVWSLLVASLCNHSLHGDPFRVGISLFATAGIAMLMKREKM